MINLALAGALATGLALAQTTTTPAQPAPSTPAKAAKARPGRAAIRHRMMKALALTPAQKTQAKQIFQQTKTANQPVRQQLQQNRQAMADAVKANDVSKIHMLAQTQANLQSQLTASRAEGMAKFYQTLTPEQKAKADQMQQNLKKRIAAKRANAKRNNG